MATAAIARVGTETDRPDGALVEAHLHGESRAFDVLYRRHRERLVRFCWQQTHDLPLAEDLAQEAMIRYLQKADTFDITRPMWPWLQTIARNLVIDHYRRTSNDPHLDPELGSVDDESTACTIRLDRIEDRSELGPVLAELPERQRIALRLHHGQDWTTADVADYLDIKVNACKQLLYRARKNARKYYEELVDSAEGAFSIVFAHPILLAMRERFQRSRTTIETLATDVAGLTIALDAVAERAIAALAVVATIALGGVDASFPVEPTTGTATPVLQEHHKLPTVHLATSASNDQRLEPRPPAQPARESADSRTALLSTGAEKSVPGVAAMSGGVSYERAEDRGKVHQEVGIDLGPYVPVSETIVTIPCDETSIVYQTVCETAERTDGMPQDDDGDSSVTSSSR